MATKETTPAGHKPPLRMRVSREHSHPRTPSLINPASAHCHPRIRLPGSGAYSTPLEYASRMRSVAISDTSVEDENSRWCGGPLSADWRGEHMPARCGASAAGRNTGSARLQLAASSQHPALGLRSSLSRHRHTVNRHSATCTCVRLASVTLTVKLDRADRCGVHSTRAVAGLGRLPSRRGRVATRQTAGPVTFRRGGNVSDQTRAVGP